MEKKTEILRDKLKSYNIDSEIENNNLIKINHKPFEFYIKFQNKKVFIESKIKGWNAVTDFMDIAFGKALNYLIIKQAISIAIIIVFSYLIKSKFDLFGIFSIVAIICFTIVSQYIYYFNYLIKHENFKNNIMKWTENESNI